MSKVYLISGFQNWGKTYSIEELFKGRKRFYNDSLYPFGGYNFCVQSQSNDDLGQRDFEKKITSRRTQLRNKGLQFTHLMAAFCPTKEPNNDSCEIIKNLFSNDQVFIIAIEYKWCTHAKLQVEELQNYYSTLRNVSIHTLRGDDIRSKGRRLETLLQPLL
ncbi:MAG: hypothetical protein ACJAVI_003140 [Candidatus Azotimanducaceae bacterium]|jgi:hypothetical protein